MSLRTIQPQSLCWVVFYGFGLLVFISGVAFFPLALALSPCPTLTPPPTCPFFGFPIEVPSIQEARTLPSDPRMFLGPQVSPVSGEKLGLYPESYL